jgi:hypothetical protein
LVLAVIGIVLRLIGGAKKASQRRPDDPAAPNVGKPTVISRELFKLLGVDEPESQAAPPAAPAQDWAAEVSEAAEAEDTAAVESEPASMEGFSLPRAGDLNEHAGAEGACDAPIHAEAAARPAADGARVPVRNAAPYSHKALREAIIMSEILSPPKALRRRY